MNKNKNTIKYILLFLEILACVVCTFFFGFLIVYGGFFYLASYGSYTSETPPGLITPVLIFLDIALVIILGASYFKNFNFKHYKTIRLFLTPIIITAILLFSIVSFFVAIRESSDHNQYYKSENISKREKIKSEKNLEVKKLNEINTFKKTNLQNFDLDEGVYLLTKAPIFIYNKEKIGTISLNPNIQVNVKPNNYNQSSKIVKESDSIFENCKKIQKINEPDSDQLYSLFIEVIKGNFSHGENFDFANITQYNCLNQGEAKVSISNNANLQITSQIIESPLVNNCNNKYKEYILEKDKENNEFEFTEINDGYNFDPDKFYKDNMTTVKITNESKVEIFDNNNNIIDISDLFPSKYPINVKITECMVRYYQEPITNDYKTILESVIIQIDINQKNINYQNVR